MPELRPAFGGLEGFEHQGRAIDAVGNPLLQRQLPVERPDQRHAVGDDQVETAHAFAKGGIAAGERGDVGVGGFHGMGAVRLRGMC